MIAKLRGKIAEAFDDMLVIDVNGVGYGVTCTEATQQAARQADGLIEFYIDHQFRQDGQQQLFGFLTKDECDCFRMLQTVQGVGGRVALAILAILSPAALVEAIICQDKQSLAQADGVGPKLAMRLVNELKDKVQKLSVVPSKVVTLPAAKSSTLHDLTSALMNLGYRPAEATASAQDAIRVHGIDVGLDVLVKAALQFLNKAG